MRFLEVVVALAVRDFEHRRPKLARERRKTNSRTPIHLIIDESITCCVTRCLVTRGTVDLMRYQEEFEIWSIYNAKYSKMWTFSLVECPLRFMVIFASTRLGNVQSFKTYVLHFWAFCHERDPGLASYPTRHLYLENCQPGWQGYPTWQTR